MNDAAFRAIEIARIDDSHRLRPVDPDYVEVIAQSMATIGLSEPVVVREDPYEAGAYILVAGAHRLAAARLNGWDTIPALIKDLEEAAARLVEIDENLMRRELGALDRAIFLAERKAVWELLHPETKHGGDQKKKQKQKLGQNDILSFSREVAQKTGLTPRTIQRATALAAALPSDLIAQLRGTYLADHASDLEALAAMEPEERAEAVRRLAAGEIRKLSAFRAPAQLPAEEREFQKLAEAWSRAGQKARKRFLRHIGVGAKPTLTAVSDDMDEVA